MRIVPGGATADVKLTIVRPVEGSRAETAITMFHDEWIGAADNWHLKSRKQMGPTKTSR